MEMNCEVLCCVAELWVNVFDFEAAGSVPPDPASQHDHSRGLLTSISAQHDHIPGQWGN